TGKGGPHFRPPPPPPGEGGKRAKERGVRFGRPRKMTPHQRQEALQRLAAGPPAQDDAPSAPGSAPAPCCRRDAGRCGADSTPPRSAGSWLPALSSKARYATCPAA